jgi:alkanesulfonate monooxygenase SsuD/methylene tetrahydromethanopterin reductase-like flavin-dependent oxidoreductase (luciferase family)
MTARMASAVDDLSGGRLWLGLGAGWQEREHRNYGWDLLDIPQRFARFEEGLEVISRLLNSDEPVDFSGQYYRLHEATLLPRPQRPDGPPILIGGNGPKYTLPLVARFAAEWNAVFITQDVFKERNALLDKLLEEHGRVPSSVRRSLMTECVFGKDKTALQSRLSGRNRSAEELKEIGLVAGTGSEIVDQLGEWEDAGVQRIMLQWLDLDDIEGLEALAQAVLPQVA